MTELHTVHRAADDVAPRPTEVRLSRHRDLEPLLRPRAKTRRAADLELAAGKLRYVTAARVDNIDAEAELAIAEAPGTLMPVGSPSARRIGMVLPVTSRLPGI